MDKRAVRIGSLMLGQGQPAVCIPVMGDSLDALALSAQRAACACADLIELRADSLCAMPTHEAAKAMCDAVRSAVPSAVLGRLSEYFFPIDQKGNTPQSSSDFTPADLFVYEYIIL